jgi:hypothetical protein
LSLLGIVDGGDPLAQMDLPVKKQRAPGSAKTDYPARESLAAAGASVRFIAVIQEVPRSRAPIEKFRD